MALLPDLNWYYIKLSDKEWAISRSPSFSKIFMRGLEKSQAELLVKMHNAQVEIGLRKVWEQNSGKTLEKRVYFMPDLWGNGSS